MTFSDRINELRMGAIVSGPDIMAALLGVMQNSDPFWDFRPDPARFTPREVLAHLADWDMVFIERIDMTSRTDNPTLPQRTPDQVAQEHNYAASDPLQSLQDWRKNRAALVARIQSLPKGDWTKPARHSDGTLVTIETWPTIIPYHDAYHLSQIADYRSQFRAG